MVTPRLPHAPPRAQEVAVNWHEVDGSKLDLLSASLTMARDMFVVRLSYVLGVWQPSSPLEGKLE